MRLLYEWIFVDTFSPPDLSECVSPHQALITDRDLIRRYLGRDRYRGVRSLQDSRDREVVENHGMGQDLWHIGLVCVGAIPGTSIYNEVEIWLNAIANSYGIPSLTRFALDPGALTRIVQDHMGPAIPSASQASTEHISRRERYRDVVPAGQRAAARRRAEEERAFDIDWNSVTHWRYSTDSSNWDQEVELSTAPNQWLWETTCWVIQNRVHLYRVFAYDSRTSPGHGAALWLRRQPLLLALVREGGRRSFTYPTDVYSFIVSHLTNPEGVQEEEPWNKSDQSYQLGALERLAEQHDRVIDRKHVQDTYGKSRRAIDLSE